MLREHQEGKTGLLHGLLKAYAKAMVHLQKPYLYAQL